MLMLKVYSTSTVLTNKITLEALRRWLKIDIDIKRNRYVQCELYEYGPTEEYQQSTKARVGKDFLGLSLKARCQFINN